MGKMSDIHLEAHQLAEEEADNVGLNEYERQNYVEKYANAARMVR